MFDIAASPRIRGRMSPVVCVPVKRNASDRIDPDKDKTPSRLGLGVCLKITLKG